jgi:hypothetical protein
MRRRLHQWRGFGYFRMLPWAAQALRRASGAVQPFSGLARRDQEAIATMGSGHAAARAGR